MLARGIFSAASCTQNRMTVRFEYSTDAGKSNSSPVFHTFSMNLSLYWSEYVLTSLKTKPTSHWANSLSNWIASNHSLWIKIPEILTSSAASYHELLSEHEQTKDFRGEASLCIRLSLVCTVVCGLDSQSKPSLSVSQDNASVSGQSERGLSDSWKDPYTTQSHPLRTNFFQSCLRIIIWKYQQRTEVRERRLVEFAREGLDLLCIRRNNDIRRFFVLFIINNKTRKIN